MIGAFLVIAIGVWMMRSTVGFLVSIGLVLFWFIVLTVDDFFHKEENKRFRDGKQSE